MVRPRGIVLALACVPLGAALTVSTAWLLSLRMHLMNGPELKAMLRRPTHDIAARINARSGGCHISWSVQPPGRWAPSEYSRPDADEIMPRWSSAFRYTPPSFGVLPGLASAGFDQARGLPFLALRCEFSHDESRPLAYLTRGGIELSPLPTPVTGFTVFEPRALPLLIIWPGFLADTAIFAALLFGLATAPGHVRRTIRLRRGHCIHCGYDLSGNPTGPCPECGTTVSQ